MPDWLWMVLSAPQTFVTERIQICRGARVIYKECGVQAQNA